MKFPRYTFDDMVEAQHRLLVDGLKVEHLRLIGVELQMVSTHAYMS